MATLIPSISCCKFDTTGERRFAQRLESKLEEDYLCWYDVPVGTGHLHPDFIVLHPLRGLIVLEVKDWRLDNIQSFDRSHVILRTQSGPVKKANPLEQARQYTHALVNVLERDPQLVCAEGRGQGKLLFPWTYGVVLTRITRKAFEQTDLGEVMPEHRVICQDEMLDATDAEEFQQRLWEMFTIGNWGTITLPQIDRVRWHLFPEIRIPHKQASLFDVVEEDEHELPDLLKVMDLQQEQLARSLGEGHRVIHGVAGSGKTLILGYRAEHLARVCRRPILVLCYNKVLARRLQHWMRAKKIDEKVHVHTFHSWCLLQLKTYNLSVPSCHGKPNREFFDQLVEKVIGEVDRNFIPKGQYDAVLIDEGHDFRPEWFKLITQMVAPQTNSLLVLYDDAQSIYGQNRKRNFSFKSVGIQAQGRTTILKVNYRNTKEILDFTAQFVNQILTQEEADEDSIPQLAPVSAGRHGSKPLVIKLPSLSEEALFIAKKLQEARKEGVAWSEMAVLYRDAKSRNALFKALCEAKIPFEGKAKVKFDECQGRVKFLTFHSSKGLEFPFVAIHGGRIIENLKDAGEEEARLLYVAMTRATSQLVMTVAG
jgi:hypothetical protein